VHAHKSFASDVRELQLRDAVFGEGATMKDTEKRMKEVVAQLHPSLHLRALQSMPL
jgi:hypothetical protein